MVAFKNIALFATGAFAAAVPRSASQVESDLKTINSDVESLTSAANKFDGGVVNAIPVASAESKVESAIKSATSDASKSGDVDAADSKTIISYINDTLEPNIAKAVKAIVSKKSEFASAGLTSTVENDFKNLKSETDAYGKALLAKAPSSVQSSGKAALAKIDAQLESGEKSFA